jgi:hypothetical protein
MSNPIHDRDQTDSQDWDEHGRAPWDGYYLAINERTRAELGTKYFTKNQVFGCWPEPPYCRVLWTGPVSPQPPCDDGSEEPGRVTDDAAVAD